VKIDQRGKVIDFIAKSNSFPRNGQNDVCFTQLGYSDCPDESQVPDSILSVFSPEEVVAMVNRYLYQMEYQRTIHREREREKQEILTLLKAKVKSMFGVVWTKATDDQIEEAAEAVRKERAEKKS
jgi:ADP-glucose pyrophosphorylase